MGMKEKAFIKGDSHKKVAERERGGSEMDQEFEGVHI